MPGDGQAAYTQLATSSQGFEVVLGPQGLGLSPEKAVTADLLGFDVRQNYPGTHCESYMTPEPHSPFGKSGPWLSPRSSGPPEPSPATAQRLLPLPPVAGTIQRVVLPQNAQGMH